MKSLKKFSVEFICNLFGFLFIDKPKVTNLNSGNNIAGPLPSELEIKMQWGEFMQTLEKDYTYLKAVNTFKNEVYQKVGFKSNEDYLASIVLSNQMMRSLIRNYSYPSGYVLN